MSGRLRASLVHVLTASGAALALMALIAAADGHWQEMFVWLGLALIVDGIDGPLARAAKVDQVLPRFSGVRLDLIVDYLTYVAVPAFALARAELLPEAFRLPAAIAILLSSLFHVADRDSKTEDGYFVGFPAIWNIVCLYLFAFMPPPTLALVVDPGAGSLHLRADPLRASVARGALARPHSDRHLPMERCRDRRRAQSISIAAMG